MQRKARQSGKSGQSKFVTSNQVRSMIKSHVENKSVHRSLVTSFPSINSSWLEVDMGYVPQGTTFYQRIGSSLKMLDITIEGTLCQGSAQSALDDSYNVVRVVLGLYLGGDTTPLANFPALFNAPVTSTWYTNGRLLKKYYDEYIPLEVTCLERAGGDGYCPGLKKFKVSVPLNVTITYGTDSTNANKVLIMSVISDSSAVVNPGFIAGYSIMNYEDS